MTTIRLRTRLGDDPKMSMRYEWFRDLHGMAHDCAVAHALLRAVGELKEARITRGGRSDIIAWIHERAAEILASDFGIPATQRSEGEEG